MTGSDLDLINRDPNGLNDHVRVAFEDVLCEPDGAHSFDCSWKAAYCCFNCCKNCCYKTLTLLCGLPLAICWGCEFAHISFWHIWYITPCMRIFLINCGFLQKFFGTCIQCFYQPYFEACSFLFSNIKVTKMSG